MVVRRIIGKTKNGKNVYNNGEVGSRDYCIFGKQDHKDAAELHTIEANKYLGELKRYHEERAYDHYMEAM